MKKLLLLFVISVLVVGCATVFSPGTQDITVITPNKKCKVYVDTLYCGQGDTVIAYDIPKNMKVKQFKIETDSFKTEYRVFFQTHKSNWYYMSWIPFGILFLMPPLLDWGDNTYNYDDFYEFEELVPITYWSPALKHIYLGNISFDINSSNSILNFHNYDSFVSGYQPYRTTQLDSMKFNNSVSEDYFEKKLKQLNFSDSSIFVDNVNTLVINCKVSRLALNEVSKRMPINFLNFANMELGTRWTVVNIYGDTLYSNDFSSVSGSFAVEANKNLEGLYKTMLNDALEIAFIDLMKTDKMKSLLKIEKTKDYKFEKIVIAKPIKNPANMEDAMKASMTIKNDNGHGSGFLVSQDGYIITNYHVINNAKNLKAIDSDGKEYTIKVIRSNPAIDLALLKIEGNFEFAFNIPTEKNFKTGQDVFAIGTPKSIELGQSISKGIISGFRTNKSMNYIQTDIGVNKGNSGGAVVSSAGDLIGVVEFKLYGLGLEGISFSIPAFDVMKSLSIEY